MTSTCVLDMCHHTLVVMLAGCHKMSRNELPKVIWFNQVKCARCSGEPRNIWHGTVKSDLNSSHICSAFHDAQDKPAWQARTCATHLALLQSVIPDSIVIMTLVISWMVMGGTPSGASAASILTQASPSSPVRRRKADTAAGDCCGKIVSRSPAAYWMPEPVRSNSMCLVSWKWSGAVTRWLHVSGAMKGRQSP